jgi:hypothetical protein
MPTRAEIDAWVGDSFRVRMQRVERESWKDPSWRVTFLTRKALVELYYVYDEPAPEGKQLIVFATPKE